MVELEEVIGLKEKKGHATMKREARQLLALPLVAAAIVMFAPQAKALDWVCINAGGPTAVCNDWVSCDGSYGCWDGDPYGNQDCGFDFQTFPGGWICYTES